MRFYLMSAFRAPAEWLMLGAFGIYSFVYPFAILLMSFDWMQFGMEWMSRLLLVLLGLSCLGWVWANFGGKGLLVAGADRAVVGCCVGGRGLRPRQAHLPRFVFTGA